MTDLRPNRFAPDTPVTVNCPNDDHVGLGKYAVPRDKFEADDAKLSVLAFPCVCCVHRSKADDWEPCRSCDHNVGAVREEPSE